MKRLLIAALGLCALPVASTAQAASAEQVLDTYADIALATYSDALDAAIALDHAIDHLVESPDAAALQAAKAAWRLARVPYQQSEAYRFGNAIVDDWEGKVNAWPLDEGLIDYVDAGYGIADDENAYRSANIVANAELVFGGRTIDASTIDADLIQSLHEIDEIEANVTTGYHAIEFLLWGQDLNGTGPGAGARPWTDFSTTSCTHGNCVRRAEYLEAAVHLLISDLADMAANWEDGGAARAALMADPGSAGLSAMVMGMGSLAYGELAGERMKLGLMLHDPEEEQDCFADNTHNSHFYSAKGIENVYLGRYTRTDGGVVTGLSLSDLVRTAAPELDVEMRDRLATTMGAFGALKAQADAGVMAYDQMLGEDSALGNALVQAAVDALVAQAETTEKLVAALNLGEIAFEGSDSLDAPTAVFQ